MAIPFVLFWVLMYVCREELSSKGITISILIWLGLLSGCIATGMSSYIFVAAQTLLDIVLILMIFRRDIKIN